MNALPMRALRTVLAFVVALVVAAPIAFFSVLFLAGPHGGALPASFHGVVLVMGWLVVVGVPSFVAYRVWHRRPHSYSNSPRD